MGCSLAPCTMGGITASDAPHNHEQGLPKRLNDKMTGDRLVAHTIPRYCCLFCCDVGT
ncbi:hypothetical protein KL86DES1_10637 [uncultured Desulfovibrio sp.]|uniref:Uncharacterized protein n=1 Tax=uncultured Desulfovibrio sp. TaxID=167968 RepID=A0A212KZQ8_9BACT|nr:hypothetical protein KL86DES1_10637 [uncultured Desulfovibrio sp.]VZH32510.1 conserved protein of unknown function [Desulfovibrio sp. 86]